MQKALEEQNAVASSGFFETASDRVRVSGRFDSVEEIRDFPIRVGDRTFRIGDVAEFAAASTIRRRRACASWARTPSAWR